MKFIYVIYIIVLISAILRPITIALHEIGHAIPALIFTKGNVNVYIGSFREVKNCIKLRMGRLHIFIKYSPMQFTGGLCDSFSSELSIFKQVVILASGPLFVFVFSFVLTYLSIVYEWPDIPKALVMILLISSVYDLFIDFIPKKKPVVNLDGRDVYNDGQAIINLIKNKKSISVDYSYEMGEHIIDLSKQFAQAGYDRFMQGDHLAAIKEYSKAIEINDQSSVYYNNRGYSYQLLEKYERSIFDFNRAVDLDNKCAYALNNRGLSLLMLDRFDEGMDDILKSINIDKDNVYAVRNLGICYYKKKDYQMARELLNKAIEKDSSIPLVHDYLEKLECK
ncbi:tetratricopeptide repeat protein [Marinifilum flexuosum]|uniref:tetratricopeptide repeat protein n=1 Tax=Marinifilum flexuosum TaxID=1117708 RepID=UPI002491B767|nr:tetratricopeptide repeat protein [Marinifilum flexuosum]